MHLMVLVHGRPEHIEDFVKWIRSRSYENNPRTWNVIPREIKLFDLVMPEEIQNQVIADLNVLQKNRAFSKMENHPVINLVKKQFDLKPVKEVPASHPSKANLLGQTGWCYLTILGKIEDERKEGGKEIL